MDKVIGWALREGRVPLADSILCVSGRLAFELVQKAAVAGCPILVGVGAPTSLAIELAADRGMTLAGFARGGGVNVYAGAERVEADGDETSRIVRAESRSRPGGEMPRGTRVRSPAKLVGIRAFVRAQRDGRRAAYFTASKASGRSSPAGTRCVRELRV